MAEEEDSASASKAGDAAAVGLAMNAAPAEDARAYLREQTELARLQKASLIEQNAFELSHLRWRRFNDQMKGALQIMVVAVGLLVVVGIGAAIWNASQAEGLVVDSFSVPPSFVTAGIGGDVVADDMTNKIAGVHDFANEHSLARSKDVREDSAEDIKVEIPETGVSFAEAWRYLRQWLGHEQHLRGNIRALPNGQIALTMTLGGGNTFTFTGAAADLDKLEQQAAEHVFATVDPVNIVLYLIGKGREAETLAAAQHLVALGGDRTTLSESYSLYAGMTREITGDAARSVALSRLAIAIDPEPAPQHMELMGAEHMLGHDESVLEQARIIGTLRKDANVGAWVKGDGVAYVQQLGAFYRAFETGDFADVVAQPCIYLCSLSGADLRHGDAEALRHDAGAAMRLVAEAKVAAPASGVTPLTKVSAPASDINVVLTDYDVDAVRGDWNSAVSDGRALVRAWMDPTVGNARYRTLYAQTQAMPRLAYALARSGDFADARKTIDATPADCYDCVRARGNIAALQQNWGDATYWFADAVKQAPSIPFAYADWGAMLMAKGALDGAIAKFEVAHQKGPHYADALEMWGEALMAKNRSDLALAKFAEANTYAPNWGRLHLKWGEALSYAGDHVGAEKQFLIAASLALPPSEKRDVEHWIKYG